MLTTEAPRTDDLLDRARSVADQLAGNTARHDAEGTYVDEGLEALRAAGLLTIGVPVELGGAGATPVQIGAVQRELAHHCGSTALGSSMHQHVVAFTAWRYRRGLPGAEATLRRVADEGLLLVSTGGGDFTQPRGTAVKVEGGFRVTGRKPFASQSCVGDVASTMFAYDDPDQGLRVLNLAVPLSADGVTVLDNWDTLGMRGTGSNDVVFDEVFVPDEKVLANRPHGTIDPPLQVIASIAFTVINGVYLGVAEAAYAAAVELVADRRDDPIVQRQVGLMSHRLRIAEWAWRGAADEVGDDPDPSMLAFAAVMAAKREIAIAGVEVCDLAMELAGGRAFYKGSVIERCYRDIRAAKFHPLTMEQTLQHAGQLALGLPSDRF